MLLFLKKLVDTNAISCQSLETYLGFNGRNFQRQYKEKLSNFRYWSQGAHAERYVVYPKNLGPYLTIYLCVGFNSRGYKEILGMRIGKTENSSFWISVQPDLKARGVEDIFITVIDNLNGFTKTIRAVFPQSTTQKCVVHQISNSCRYVVWTDLKDFAADMKEVYTSVNRDQADIALEEFVRKWGSKYHHIVQAGIATGTI
ncbi:MAG: transposase [Parabacteroides sp.]|nr:transposase [Parabacteroides sp.]